MTASGARSLARIGGLLYLVIIVIGALGEAVVRGRVVVPDDTAATLANLRTMESLWRLGVAGEIVLLNCALALGVILYILLRPVSRDLALTALLFNLACIAIEAVAAVFLATALHTETPLLAVRAHTFGFAIALIFFGVECVILGYLIYRGEHMPKTIGVLMVIAGVCYVLNSFAVILSPRLAGILFPAILLPCLVAELSLAVWMVVKGVRAERWDALNAATARAAR